MDSFEDLGLGPELVEALAAEGIEQPTPLQEVAIPVVRRGNNLILAAGPGSGLMVSWGAALLDRVSPDAVGPCVLVLAPSRDRADHLAESMGRLAIASEHGVGALGSRWVLPERATLLFSTPADVLAACGGDALTLEGIEALVVDQASRIEVLDGFDALERVFQYAPKEAQRVVTALPLTEGVTDFCERHVRRAVTVPAEDASTADGPRRGSVRFRIAPEPREVEALEVVGSILADGARHVLLYCRNEDRAADVGDYLTLHGYMAGAPGDTSVPVWLGVDALVARQAAEGHEDLCVVSCDAPTDPDALDRRHSLSDDGVIVALAREVPHLRATARRAGYDVVPFPPAARRSTGPIAALHDSLRTALAEEDTAAYLLALEPLFDEHDPAEVAAAAVALLRKRSPQAQAPASRTGRDDAPGATPAWAKLFFGVGERDGLRPGDLLGAITGEADVPGDAVGRIDIKESHSLVEVHDDVARKVIKALNGTTIRGRAVRADFDRPKRGGRSGRGPRPG